MSYAVKEIFLTLQGEGAHSGRVAVFCRFSGCNLWSGRASDRSTAVCRFCDTDFVGMDGSHGGRYADAPSLVSRISEIWGVREGIPFVVLTGGEPMLQVDGELVRELHRAGFEIAVETNGTLDPPDGLDWVCVSPKAGSTLRITSGDELKLVYPQPGVCPDDFISLGFRRFSLSPMDGPDADTNARLAVEYCVADPRWRLSVQTHKHLGFR